MIPDSYQHFVQTLTNLLVQDDEYLALAAGGSWIDGQMDRFSDIDLVIVHQSESLPLAQRQQLAEAAGDLLVCFTGEHVGEPRLLICLYDHPVLHVDLKFVHLADMATRVENPLVLWERETSLSAILAATQATFPYPNFQWIEDRFWVWIHYAAAKIGRGEVFETLTFLAFMQQTVLGPLALIRNGSLPKGVRKLEMILPPADLQALRQTTALYDKQSCLDALYAVVAYYRTLRTAVMDTAVEKRDRAEQRVMEYVKELEINGV